MALVSKHEVHIIHNIVWSKYKGGVFSELYRISDRFDIEPIFTQIAETESDRVGLSGVDISYHRYPYALLFKGAYDSVSKMQMARECFRVIWKSDAILVILPGYHKTEFWLMLVACILQGKRRAVFCDSTSFDRPQSAIRDVAKRIFFSFCHGFFGYGERSRDYLIGLGAKKDSIYHRCQAAALQHDYSPDAAFSSRIEQVVPASAPRYLYVGRMSGEKGLDTLLNAFHSVLAQQPLARLVFVGAGPLLEQLKTSTEKLGLVGAVEFAGSKDIAGLAKEYAKATCLVLPSRSEPWGLVVNEALSYGCPVVVSNACGCVPELVLDGVSGYRFETNNSIDLAEKLLRLNVEFNDPRKTARQCLDLISKFSPQHAAEQILTGCRSILEKGN